MNTDTAQTRKHTQRLATNIYSVGRFYIWTTYGYWVTSCSNMKLNNSTYNFQLDVYMPPSSIDWFMKCNL